MKITKLLAGPEAEFRGYSFPLLNIVQVIFCSYTYFIATFKDTFKYSVDF